MLENHEPEPRFITLKEAAARAHRSYSWAWDRAGDGRFETRRGPQGVGIFVSEDSVRREIAKDRLRRKPNAKRAAHLRLVVDNTK